MRARYNPVRWFYESIPFDQEKFLLLAMDESKHIVYFTDFEVLRHSINPDLDETARLKEAIDARMSGGTEVYVAPGFFTSDKAHNIRTMIGENYDLMPVYENWFENHYRISLGLPLREVVDYCRRQCDPKNALVKTKKEDRSSPLVTYEIVMEYEDGESEVYYTVGLLGRAMSSIVREVVFRLRPREL